MQRDLICLADILDSARLAIEYVQDTTQERFAEDVQLQDSVIRRLEVIGEAARRVSEDGRRRWSALPWADLIGMRNIMIHQYEAVDLAIVWQAVRTELAPLVSAIEAILASDATEA